MGTQCCCTKFHAISHACNCLSNRVCSRHQMFLIGCCTSHQWLCVVHQIFSRFQHWIPAQIHSISDHQHTIVIAVSMDHNIAQWRLYTTAFFQRYITISKNTVCFNKNTHFSFLLYLRGKWSELTKNFGKCSRVNSAFTYVKIIDSLA